MKKLCGRRGAEKNLHLGRVGAFENPQLTRGCLSSGFWIPLSGWACKPRKALLAPSGYSIGSSKEFAGFTYTAEVCPAVAGRTKGLYHLNGAVARAARGRRG